MKNIIQRGVCLLLLLAVADYNKDGSWWCLTDAAGEMTSVGVADIELHDGDSYAFTYTK